MKLTIIDRKIELNKQINDNLEENNQTQKNMYL